MPRVTLTTDGGYFGDVPAFQIPDGGLSKANNCFRHDGRWFPMPEFSSTATVTAGACLNALGVQDIGNSLTDIDSYVFVHYGNSIMRYKWDASAAVWDGASDVTPAATSTASSRLVLTSYYGDFIFYGGAEPWILAFPGNAHAIQVMKDVGNDAFTELSGSPKAAQTGIIFRNHLVTAGLYNFPKSIQMSAYNDITAYSTTFDLNTGASLETFNDQGPVQGLGVTEDAFGIFHDRDISMGWWSGYPTWFSFKKGFHKGVGALPGSIVSARGMVFFWGLNNAYVMYGQTLEAIGTKAVRTIIQAQRAKYVATEVRKITTYHWAERNTVMWCYKPVPTASTEIRTHVLLYNYVDKTWSMIEDVYIQAFFDILTATGRPMLGAVAALTAGGAAKTMLFNGANRTMSLETRELRDPEGQLIQVNRVRASVSAAGHTTTVRVGTRMLEDVSATYTSALSANSDGYFNTLQTGRMVRVEVNTNVTWSAPIDVDYNLVGDR